MVEEDVLGWQDIVAAAEKGEKLPAGGFAYDSLAWFALRVVIYNYKKGEYDEAGKNKLVSAIFNSWCHAARQMNDALEKGLHIEIVEDGKEWLTARVTVRADEFCLGCRFYQGKTCQYLEIAGHMRGCKPGKGCERYAPSCTD